MHLDIKFWDGKFQVGLFDEYESFPFSNGGMPDKSRNIPFYIVYSSIGAWSLRIVRVSNKPDSF